MLIVSDLIAYKIMNPKKVIIFFVFMLLFSCTIDPLIKKSGISNLVTKQESLIIGTTNKNDTTILLGETILKEFPDNNYWLYIEMNEKNSYFGKKEIIKHNLLMLKFNHKGVLEAKKIFDLKNFNSLSFDKEFTKTFSLDETSTKKFLNSMKQRMKASQNNKDN